MFNYIKENRLELFFICVITFIAFAIRVIAIQNFGDLWVDELYSFYFANKDNPLEIAKTLFKEDFHVPLYFILLHYWMKLFGQNDFVIRLLGCIITTLSLPAVFYLCKNLFNKQCAYLSALFIAINSFNIHYSCELRFYGSTIFLAVLSAYFFVKTFDKFEKKYIVSYIFSTLLLLYTYNFAFMYVFCQFIVGLCYVLKNKNSIYSLAKIYIVIFVFYLPVIFYILHSFFMYRTALLSFFRDIFSFDLMFFYNFLLTCYSNVFDQWMNNNIMQNDKIIKIFLSPFVLFFMTMPIILGLAGLIRAFREKNKNFILFFTPAFILFVVQILFVFAKILALNLRYTVIPVTIFTVAAVYGWSLFKNKKLSYSIFSVWILLNLCTLFFVNNSAINRNIAYSGNLEQVLISELKSDDLIFIPRFSKLYGKYIKRGNVIDFDTYDAFLLGTRNEDIEFIFGKDLSQKLNRKMLKTYLYSYITTDAPSLKLEENLKNEYFSKMKKGQRFVIITDETSYINDLEKIQDFIKPIDVYSRSSVYYPLSAKITYDIIGCAFKNFKTHKNINVNSFFSVLIFE